MGKDVIIALDFDSKEKTLAFLDRFTGKKPFVKIGMELFYAEGPSIVREISGMERTLAAPMMIESHDTWPKQGAEKRP